MDEYIKMCSLLEPLQEEREPLSGLVFLPDSDWLMEKLGDRNWGLDKCDIRYMSWVPAESPRFISSTPKIALLKLVAFELWGLEWKDERWV